MAKITIFGDFKTNHNKHLCLSGELMFLLNTSDINVVNFEAPVHNNGKIIPKSGPNLCQDIESTDWLIERGFTAVSLANNHTMDYGEEGLKTTQKHFKNVPTMGVGLWNDAYKMHTFFTSDGLRIGFICCTHCEFGTLTDKFLQHNEAGCAWTLSIEIQKLITSSKNKVDCLIVIPHGGVEYMEQPLPEWRDVYKMFIDLGADAVIASHPHIPQGWEIYKNKPICYSLGNFCFEWTKRHTAPTHWFESLCCILEVTKPHQIEMNIRPILFNQKIQYICDNNSSDFSNYLNKINDILKDDKRYISYVNEYVKKLLPFYYQQFSRSGWNYNIFSKGFLKGIADGFLKKGFLKSEHALNNIQCESHRWAILRALKNNI